MEELVERLTRIRNNLREGLGGDVPSFPSARVVIELEELVINIARTKGLQKASGLFLWGAFKHLDHELPSLKLTGTLGKLIARIPNIPPMPRLLLREALLRIADGREFLSVLDPLFDSDLLPERFAGSDFSWEDLFHILKPLTSTSFRELAPISSPNPKDRRFAGWCAFLDIKQQEIWWHRRYGDAAFFLQWVAGLHVDEFTELLKNRTRSGLELRSAITKRRARIHNRHRIQRARSKKRQSPA